MWKMFLLLVITGCLLSFISCECISPVCDIPPSFMVVDKTTRQNLVFSSQPKYPLDSIFITISGNDAFFHFRAADSIRLVPDTYGAGLDTIFVHFDATGIDTLVFTYQFSRHTYCCKMGTSSVKSVTDNGVSLSKTDDIFIIEK